MRVGLFVTCLVDAMRPSIGFATLELLERAGCEVVVPEGQTCCGQPAWNSGDAPATRALALKWLKEFDQFDYVVAPSGSCVGMTKVHYLDVFKNDPEIKQLAASVASKTHELTDFLVNVLHVQSDVLAKHASVQTVTYHDCCSGLRELGVKDQPRQLMALQGSTQLCEMRDSRQCCGFGGTFAVKYGEVSAAICDDKCEQIKDSQAQAVVLGDLGCMLNIQGRMERLGEQIQVLHIAELLTGRKAGQLNADQGA